MKNRGAPKKAGVTLYLRVHSDVKTQLEKRYPFPHQKSAVINQLLISLLKIKQKPDEKRIYTLTQKLDDKYQEDEDLEAQLEQNKAIENHFIEKIKLLKGGDDG